MRVPSPPNTPNPDVLEVSETLVSNSVVIHHLAFPDRALDWYRQQLRRKSCRDFCTLLRQQCFPRVRLQHNDLGTLVSDCKDAISEHEARGRLGRLWYDTIVPDKTSLFAVFSWVDIKGLDLSIEEYESGNRLLDAATLGYIAAKRRTAIPWDNPRWLETAVQLASSDFEDPSLPPRPPATSTPPEIPSGYYSANSLSSGEDERNACGPSAIPQVRVTCDTVSIRCGDRIIRVPRRAQT